MEQIVLNQLMNDGMCQVKLLSDTPVRPARMLRFVPTPALDFAEVNCYDTAALCLFYGEVKYPVREVVEMRCEGWILPRQMVVWKLMPGERMSEELKLACAYYFQHFFRYPTFAFVRNLPRDIGSEVEVGRVLLLQAEWAIPGCLMVGGRPLSPRPFPIGKASMEKGST